MPPFTVETTFRMPYYRQRTYEAETAEDACRLAVEDEDWDSAKRDWECAGETYVTGVWSGTDMAYEGTAFTVPSDFDEAIQRKADHFHELTDLLDTVARATAVSQADFEAWRPRALAALAKAKAVIEGRRDPGEMPVELVEPAP